MTTRHYQAQALPLNETILLDEATSHHVATVLRKKVGEAIVLFNGDGQEVSGVISDIRKKAVSVLTKERRAPQVESPCQIHLIQAIGKGERMDWVLQKATELGVASITPVISDYVNVRLDNERSEKKLQHWEKILISAAEQSERVRIPALHSVLNFSQWMTESRVGLKLLFHPDTEKTIHELPAAVSEVYLLIGPEGGWSDSEVLFAKQHGTVLSKSGPRILRMETAACAAITLCQSRWGDF